MSDDVRAECIWQNQDFSAPQVKEARRGMIGASEIGIVCGLNPYVSPLQLWAEKTGKAEPGIASLKMRVGKLLEPTIGKLFQEEHPTEGKVVECQQTFRSVEAPFAIATPDFWIETSEKQLKILEVKCIGERGGKNWADGAIPDTYYAQVQYQLRVLQLGNAWISALVGNEHLESRAIEHDKSLTDTLLEAGEHFIECCKRDIPPNAGPNDASLVKSLITPSQDVITIDSGDVMRWAAQWYDEDLTARSLKNALRPIEARMAEAKHNIMLAMQGAKVARCGKYKISSTIYPIKEKVISATTGARFNVTLEDENNDD